MKQIILAKCGELVLKGLNRSYFERTLMDNIRKTIKPYGEFSVSIAQSTIYVKTDDDFENADQVAKKMQKIFGIAAICVAGVCEKNIDDIIKTTLNYLEDDILSANTFKVEAKRSDKKFGMKSPEICATVGEKVLDNFEHISVDVHNPDIIINVEIRDFGAYVHAKRLKGAGGMPYGTNGEGCLMLSGGIDSPVAGYMIAKRGVKLNAIHFFSPPYTSERAKQKVIKLAEILSDYCPSLNLHVVNFTKAQKAILETCENDLFTVIMRVVMMKVCEKIMVKTKSKCIITGESLGQVASQTMEALNITDNSSSALVLRPLIGMDKNEIVEISRKIGAYETSIEPYEDCCTVFTPRHPKTKPNQKEIDDEIKKLDLETLVDEAVQSVELIKI